MVAIFRFSGSLSFRAEVSKLTLSVAELSSCGGNRDCISHKTKDVYCLAPQEMFADLWSRIIC